MSDKKSILEEALLDIKNIQNALNANTKEILRSVAKEEIDSVVKESLVKEDFTEEDLEPKDDSVELGGDANAASADVDPTLGGEESNPDDVAGTETSEVAPEMEPEIGMDADALGGDLDMTSASDEDVIAVYKKLSGEDEIQIVGDEIHLNVSEPGEYVIKAKDEPVGGEVAPIASTETPVGDEDEVDYEIEMGDEGEGNDENIPDDLVPVGEEGSEEDEEEDKIEEKISVGTGMSVGTHRNKTASGSIGASENPKSKLDESSAKLVSEAEAKYKKLVTESNKLKAENEEFRKALKEFRTKLVETVIFNSNLTYVTRLFMEHSTTKNEKENIIKRFDEEVTDLKESKKLYKTIANELAIRKPVSESVEKKITKEATTSVSKQLNENTVYVDPSTKRIMDLIKRVENR